MTLRTRPSLFGDDIESTINVRAGTTTQQARTLSDLLYDGFFMVFLLKQKHTPGTTEDFNARLHAFLAEFDQGAKKLGASLEDTHAAKYAFCAAVDECILSSTFALRAEWERKPLQITLFGEQLAGEHFFELLETCRAQGKSRLPALEVFHLCLLLGFEGKYRIGGQEKLAYLTARLGDEIAAMKGRRTVFAPHWARPDNVMHQIKQETSLWAIAGVFSFLSLLAFTVLFSTLRHHNESVMAEYNNTINLGPKAAHLTITLP